MKKEFKEKFPQWVFEGSDYTLCMSDDIDSLVGATILQQVKGWEIKHFYNFHNLYSINRNDKRKAIGVDIALVNGMTFDNHCTMLSANSQPNLLSANPNVIERISRDNYTKKFAMSTTLLIWALYDLPIPSTEDGKLMLMSIDSSFLGYYKGFKNVQVGWLEKLGMEEMIYLQERHSISDFVEVKRRFKSSEKIFINDNGFLETEIQLEGISDLLEFEISLPTEKFELRKQFERKQFSLNHNGRYSNSTIESVYKPFSYALTSKNKLQMTVKSKENEKW